MVGEERFIEVYVDTPIDVCEQRDVKGLYARARRGQITGFTGVDDPYEEPVNPEITLYTVQTSPDENARIIVKYLEERGFLMPDGNGNAEQEPAEQVSAVTA
jgi:sulfate adenylyltransferase